MELLDSGTDEQEHEFLSTQVERLYSLLHRDASSDARERLGPDELEELRFYRERVSAEEWAQLQAAAVAHHREAGSSQPSRAASRTPGSKRTAARLSCTEVTRARSAAKYRSAFHVCHR